jgi:hypothetical protein
MRAPPKTTWIRIAGIVLLGVGLVVLGARVYFEQIANPRVVRELLERPGGERAQRVMLLTLPSGRELPVNYLREGDLVYAGADGRWWRELAGDGATVQVWVRGERWTGHGRAIRDDPAHAKAVFARLRPDAIEGFGTLVEIALDERLDASRPEDG